jgi:hypothetical protein
LIVRQKSRGFTLTVVTDNVRDSGQLSNSTSGNRDRRNGTGNKKETTSEIEQYNKMEELLPVTLKFKTKQVTATVYCTDTTYKHTKPRTTNSYVLLNTSRKYFCIKSSDSVHIGI